MKRPYIFLLVAVVLAGFGLLNIGKIQASVRDFVYQTPCDTPVGFSIGEVDPKFSISKSEVLQYALQAQQTWSDAYGKTLFKYDPESEFKVNLTYDVRQRLNSQISDLNSDLEARSQQIEPEIQAYEKKVDDFKVKIAALNSEIDEWNNKGGAPPDVYKNLIERQAQLKTEADKLNEEAKSLNQSTQKYNLQVGQLNQKVNTFNQVLEYKPEEGIFMQDSDGRRIVIFFYTSKDDLVHTLTHEFGHALGMDHVQDEEAIMFHSTNGSLVPTETDLAELAEVCEKRNIFITFASKIAQRISIFSYLDKTSDVQE
jgi:hypothetical protein